MLYVIESQLLGGATSAVTHVVRKINPIQATNSISRGCSFGNFGVILHLCPPMYRRQITALAVFATTQAVKIHVRVIELNSDSNSVITDTNMHHITAAEMKAPRQQKGLARRSATRQISV